MSCWLYAQETPKDEFEEVRSGAVLFVIKPPGNSPNGCQHLNELLHHEYSCTDNTHQ